MALQIHDTAQRSKRAFEPLEAGHVKLYVCGLTVYDLPHIGHARTFVTFDVVGRFLRSRGLKVTLVRNHTDVDDKIIRRARELGESAEALASRMIDELGRDMDALGIERADIEPRVTQHIPEIVAMTQELVDKGYGYPIDGDVYYRVRRFDGYGALSNRKLDELQSGARVEVDERKQDPLDFALWKSSTNPDEPGWDSPWGRGRPGWHIECSAMSTKYLGPSFDIHGGGRDLIFPHHENEIAQSVAATGGQFARYWMHVGMVEIDGEKMSHSLKNFWTIRDLLAQVHPEALRFFFLTTQYRNNINFSRDAIQDATTRVTSLYRLLEQSERLLEAHAGLRSQTAAAEKLDAVTAAERSFVEAMEDDFNTPRALAALAELEHLGYELVERKGKQTTPRLEGIAAVREALLRVAGSVGLLLAPAARVLEELRVRAIARLGLDPTAIDALVAERAAARAAKDWARADAVRAELEQRGVQILDRVDGTIWQVT